MNSVTDKTVFWEVTMTLAFDQQNLITSPSSPQADIFANFKEKTSSWGQCVHENGTLYVCTDKQTDNSKT